ncbi:MAG: ABC transporter ATP-binding protein [Pirellulales bacterium]
MPDTTNAIEVRGLVKRYGDFTAVDGLSLDVRRGELLSMLGPNGAGKSTTIRVLTTLLPATEGEITIHGMSVPRENAAIKPLLGLVPQEIALYETLSARNNLRFFSQMYKLWGAPMEARVSELLEAVELTDKADSVAVSGLSGGMQRRVNIAAALVHDPEIVFMDEPTVGLDPATREAIWKVIERLKARGKTIILTTHYMEEAEALCDRVAIVDHGKLIAQGTPAELVRATGISTVLELGVRGDTNKCLERLKALPQVGEASAGDGTVRVATSAGSELLPQVIQTLQAAGLEVRHVDVQAPNLGAVYLHYTGRELRN